MPVGKGKITWKRRMAAGRIWVLALALSFLGTDPGFAMEAPGDQDSRWEYSQEDHNWYFYETDRTSPYIGWLDFHGERYWFDEQGRMADNGFRSIGGKQYYFFINGHMARNQFVGMKYYGEDGQPEDAHDVRKFGKESITTEQRDLFSDALYEVPRSWIARFMEEGWQFMCYTSKKYFSAPDTDMGIYYVYHSVDTHYRKLKFTDVDAVLQAFGEYVGYSAGLYKKDHVFMEQLWADEPALGKLLDIPDYYSGDSRFYFGKLFAAYLDEQQRTEILRTAPKSAQVLEELLHMHDTDEVREWHRQRLLAEQEEAASREQRRIQVEGYGPGVPRETKTQAEEGAGQEAAKQESTGQEDIGQEGAGA